MGLRTEIEIDGDKCHRCGCKLALEGIALDRFDVEGASMIITIVPMLCTRCFAVTNIPYRGEFLPTEPMKERNSSLPGKRKIAVGGKA